jgi:hypothetical protein
MDPLSKPHAVRMMELVLKMSLTPSPELYAVLAKIHQANGDLDAAIQVSRRSLELTTNTDALADTNSQLGG